MDLRHVRCFSFLSPFFQRHILVIFLLGVSSGLPLALILGTLQAWFTADGLSLKTIGLSTLIGLPYTIKYLWSPVLDRYTPPFGRRRGWLFITQGGLFLCILWMSSLTPQQQFTLGHTTLPWLLIAGFSVALFSASQDIVINAYQTEIINSNEKGLSAGLYTSGYRIGFLLSGAVALILADFIGWHLTYLFMAFLMLIGVCATLMAKEPERGHAPRNLTDAIIHPFSEFFRRYRLLLALTMLLLIILYKFGDALVMALSTTFLLRELGFSLSVIGGLTKTIGFASALLGGLVGGALMLRMRLFHALLLFGLLQASANLSFFALALVGKQYGLLVLAIFSENFLSGMGTTAFVALIMSQCHPDHTATQFALLTSLASIARTFVGPIAAWMVQQQGWADFFLWTFFLSLPCLGLVMVLKQQIEVTESR